MKKRILLVEDEEGLLVSLSDRLASEDYDVHGAADGQIGYERAVQERFDLLVLDVRLPSRDGFDVCRSLRQRGINMPILMLTARGQLDDRVLGLKLGADDYLVKPFEPVELLARIQALLRRASGARHTPDPDVYEFGAVHVDLVREQVSRDRAPLPMLPLEYRLLRYFIQHRNATLSRHQLLDEVWGYDAMPTTRTVDVHVAGIRQKIEPDPRRPRFLLTVHRRGYKFVG
jgi:two-component system, OmpR family, alkaline phosphatase synthesis response regulator PhoP